jgi:hypothetical protein
VVLSAAVLLGGPGLAVATEQQDPAFDVAALDHRTAEAGNPIVDGWYADPDVQIYDGRFWVFPTTSRVYEQQTFMDAFSSTDLVHWTKHSRVLDIADISWAEKALWAPAPVERNGKYYLYFAANDIQSNDELGGIGVAVADSPDGPYVDAIGKPLISQFHNGAQPIDQDVFIDDDGQAYMYYGGWHHSNVVKLNEDMTSLGTFDDGTTFKEITPENYTEGSFMFKRDGRYYLMWSEGGWTGPDYSVSYAIADSPTGPFERVGKVLAQDPAVARGSGHNSVINVPGTDIWYIFYHRRPLSETDGNSRALAYDRMYFNEDGTIRPITMMVEDNFDDDNAVGWRSHGDGEWTAADGAYTARSSSSTIAVQDKNFSDLIYRADVTLTRGRGDAGLVFRVTRPEVRADGYRGYYASLRPNGVVLSKASDGRAEELASARLRVEVDKTHRMKVEAVGPNIKVYVDDMTTPKLSVTDDSYTSGTNGLRVSPRTGVTGENRSGAAPQSVATFDNVAIRSNVFSFEAAEEPNEFIRHAYGRVRVDANVTPFADMQWKVVPGLADPSAVSLESVNFPGQYLRHRDGEVWKEALGDGADARADATWYRRPGLSDPSLTSFESYNSPGEYLVQRDSLLFTEPVAESDHGAATFRAW